jgi:antitoxin component YwqK of YwqJK toxin-antitoxin module
MGDLVYRDGIYYKKFSDVPFTGVVNGFDQISSLVIQGNYKHGKREGPWVTYNANGQLIDKGEYKNGKRVGPWIAYWKSGRLASKGAWKNGKKEGRWVAYHENGDLWEEYSGVYKNGVKISD